MSSKVNKLNVVGQKQPIGLINPFAAKKLPRGLGKGKGKSQSAKKQGNVIYE